MSFEDKIIGLINGEMPRSPLRKSVSGEVDSELIILGDKEYLFTTDDFSQEDLLREDDPGILGWNIACGAISDIIAAGGKPLVYSHSMVIPPAWDEIYIREFSRGVSAVLQKYSISFIGGDIGFAENWRYTASVIGESIGNRVNRRGCKAGDLIFLTGKIGAGNLDAILHLYKGNLSIESLLKGNRNKFHSHENLPGIISEFATCAIDTSDGVLAALQTISSLNKTGFKISNLPFAAKGILAAGILQVPELLLFMGECGEYEILFTVSRQSRESLEVKLNQLEIEAYNIGEISERPALQTVIYKENRYDFTEYNVRARDFTCLKDYLRALTAWVGAKGLI